MHGGCKGRAGAEHSSSSKSPKLEIEINDSKGENKVNGKLAYEMEEVLDNKFNSVRYLVKWKGFTAGTDLGACCHPQSRTALGRRI